MVFLFVVKRRATRIVFFFFLIFLVKFIAILNAGESIAAENKIHRYFHFAFERLAIYARKFFKLTWLIH